MKNKKILILGKGFIGSRLQKELGGNIDGSMISCFADAQKLVDKYHPKIIINCIGVTGKHNVDDCELEKDTTLLANSFVPIILAEIRPGGYNVIDGNHRLEKAYRMGVEYITAYRLKPDQHMPFLTSLKAYHTYVEYWNSKIKSYHS